MWSVVFPLGMYSVATLTFGHVAHLAFMEPLARFLVWVAVAMWVLVAVAFLKQLGQYLHPGDARGRLRDHHGYQDAKTVRGNERPG